MKSQVEIRPMEEGDLPQVTCLDSLCFSDPWPENSFLYDLQKNENARLWVAEVEENEEKKIVAMIVVWLMVDEVQIGTLAVHPDYRRCGIAARLLSLALETAAKSGYYNAFLEVRQQNNSAQSLYRRFGFEVVGIRKRYYKDNGEDAIMMSRFGSGHLPELLPKPEITERICH